MKNANELQELLRELNACPEAVEWSEGKTWEQVYEECPRGDWLLWLFDIVSDDRRKIVLTAAHCANTVRHLMKDERSRNAADAAISYGNGDSTKDELKTAATAAAAAYADAYADSYAAYAAAYAAYAAVAVAAYAAAYAYAPTYTVAAAAPAYAAAAAYAYADSYAAAKKQNQKQTADIVRKYIPIEDFNLENKIS